MNDIKQFEPLWGVWKTEALIGEGSYGKVYRAVREEFGRKYYAAVKHISIPTSESQITEAISEGIADDNESVKEYFEAIAQNLINEITLMNDVKGKSNIVSYEDHLIIPKSSGVGYDIIIRMELLTGLNDILRHKQLTNKDVIKLGMDLCSALEVCVEKGIVHRDIKPSNIFVSDNGDYKLGDFGVARELEHTTSAMSKKGTYIYMAPEVYKGEPANFSADIFSLGIVMYRLLNGNRAPFLPVSAKIKPGDNENALARRMSGEPMPAPAFAEEGLAQIILKATQFDRTKRYASPTEMKNDLIRLSGGAVMERTIPIIAEPTHNSVSFRKRNAAGDQGTVLLFPEQNVAEASVRDKQDPVYYTGSPQSNRTVYANPAPVNRPAQNPRPVAQPAKDHESAAASQKSRPNAIMIALLCVLVGGLLIGFVVMIALSAGKLDTVDSVDETVSSSVEEDKTSSQDPFEANAKSLDNSYIIDEDYKTGNTSGACGVCRIEDKIFYADGITAITVDGSKINRFYHGNVSLLAEHNNDIYGLIDFNFQKFDTKTSKLSVLLKPDEGERIETFCFGDQCIYCFVTKDLGVEHYAFTSFCIYQMNLDGSNAKVIFAAPDNMELLIDGNNASVSYYNGRLYYGAKNRNNYQNSLFSIDKDGNNNTKEFDWNGIYSEGLIFSNNRVYINSYYEGLFSCNLDKSDKRKLVSRTESFCCLNNQIAYTEYNTVKDNEGDNILIGKNLHFLDNNSKDTVYFQGLCDIVGICGNWIYFYDRGNDWDTLQWKLCRIRLDGTGLMELPEVY